MKLLITLAILGEMAIWTVILLPIVFANMALSTKNTEFIHVGTFRSGNGVDFDVNDYFVSPNAVSWSTAEQSCKNLFGRNSSTLAIESVEEWEFLKILLEPHGIGLTYWTSGMYDAGSRIWRWSSNNLPIMPWAPWDSGHPANTPTGIHRILTHHMSQYSASWRTVQNSQFHRYICETRRPPDIPITCEDNDLIIVLDSSASIGSHNYKKAKQFAAKVFEEITVHNASRIAFSIYADVVNTIINLNNSLSQEQIINAILEAPYMKGATATHLAINVAVTEFNSFPRDVPLNLLVITDGESYNSTLTAAAIQTAIGTGVRPFAVGISPSAVQKELSIIANGNSENVFNSDRCDDLLSLLQLLRQQVCSNN